MKVLPTALTTVLDLAEKKAHPMALMTDLHLALTKVQMTALHWAQKKVALVMMVERISKVQ